jgi:hypothetical protein
MKHMLWGALLIPLLVAGCQNDRPEKLLERAVHRIHGELNLNADQDQKLRVLADAVGAQVGAQRDAAGAEAPAWDRLLEASTFAVADAEGLANARWNRLAAGREEALKTILPPLGAFLDSLNPGQKKKLNELRHRWMGAAGGSW